MIDHLALQLALRAHALTLEVCTTGTTTLEATATGYARASGSFLTDGFAVGMEVTPSGFPQTAVGVITAVTALTMTINGGRTVATAAGGRSLRVLLPSVRRWENVDVTPTAAQPWVEEEYLPGPLAKTTLGAFGDIEALPQYVLRFGVPTGGGATALRRYTGALLTHFAPTTPISVSGGTVRVRADVGPFASPVSVTAEGWAVSSLSIPLRYTSPNPR